ncbi:MAG: class I mannose-6-phosphate isomerase [Planctomycetia bacterium]|jgi:mannose-6-phosphate isomerase
MNSLYPLRFDPIYKQYLWGGCRFQNLLHRDLPTDEIFSESWEISDHGDDQSVVTDGPLAGETLGALVARFGKELVGPEHGPSDPFPLLVKFIDAAQNLSLQVHPDDAMGATLDPPDSGKTEAWVVLDAEPNSQIYAGLKAGVTRDDFQHALEAGTVVDLLCTFQVRPGDCILIPSGTVHAIGKGILVAEVQQSSDTTFRLFDWGRLGTDGKPRPLHIEQGLQAVKFGAEPSRVKRRRRVASEEPVEGYDYYDVLPSRPVRLAECDKFLIDILYVDDPSYLESDGFRIVVVLGGEIRVQDDPNEQSLSTGQTILLPPGKHHIVPIKPSLLIDAQLPSR